MYLHSSNFEISVLLTLLSNEVKFQENYFIKRPESGVILKNNLKYFSFFERKYVQTLMYLGINLKIFPWDENKHWEHFITYQCNQVVSGGVPFLSMEVWLKNLHSELMYFMLLVIAVAIIIPIQWFLVYIAINAMRWLCDISIDVSILLG